MKKSTKNPKKLLLIDGNAIIHRAYHALPPLTTKSGELVNAVYGFTSTLLSVIDKFKPDYIAASFDLAALTFRHEKFTAYKATRVKGDDELYAQIPRVKEVVKAFNIPIFEKEGFEADDVIGTLAKQADASSEHIETIIVTGDMDTLQLITEKTRVYTMQRGLSDAIIYDKDAVMQRYNLRPDQLIDFKGLRGDPSDNIPGVKGIGEKTAISLLGQYESIEGVYEHINEIKGATKDKLERDKAQALMSKDLATIETNVPVNLDLQQAQMHQFDRKKITQLLSDLNFFSLIKRLPQSVEDEKTSEEIKKVADFKYAQVTKNELDNLIKEILEQNEVAVYVEQSEQNIHGVSFSYKKGRAFYVPFTRETNTALKSILESDSIKKIGYDLKAMYKVLYAHGIKLGNISFDVMIASYVLDPGRPIVFDQLVFSQIGEEIETTKSKKGQLSILQSENNNEQNMQHACKMADYTFKLKEAFEKNIVSVSKNSNSKKTASDLFSSIEMPLVEILAQVELCGIKLNTVIFEGISKKLELRLKNLECSIYELSGKEFNINSPHQLAHVLFEVLNLSTSDIKKTKTGFSTASSELEKLRKEHKIINKIEQYRELFKLKTTYLDTLPLLVDAQSRLHTTFNQAVTSTGRLSSTEPNLQNIPIKTELGQILRTAFVAEDGFLFIGADYSQIDLRVVAHVSGDKKLIEAFHRGDDIHKITAAEVNKVTLSQVTETMRRNAKALNFGIIYGMSAFGFSQSAGISREDAQQFINTYMEKFEGVARYMKETREFAHEHGYVETQLGRRKNIAEINSPNFQIASSAERMAINMPIQGLAADIVKLAMIETYRAFEDDPDVRMVLQIHDEIILEVKKEKARDVSAKLKEIMETVYPLRVPLVVDVKIGENWGEI